MIQVVDLSDKFGLFSAHWKPRIVAVLNESYVKLAKLKGEFIWHKHELEDELFLVVKGSLIVRLRDGDVEVREGQLVVVPRGIEHMPVAGEEVHVVFIEPKGTVNTGDAESDRTVTAEWI